MAISELPLRSIRLEIPTEVRPDFPFSVPVIRSLTTLNFTSPVTFFVGENGSGKSTLLEGLAAAAGSITVGSAPVEQDQSLLPAHALARHLRLIWSKRSRRGFFLRSEDFFGYARRLSGIRAGLQEDLADVERSYANRSPTARAFARSAYTNELGSLEHSYGPDLDARSHGESYLTLFQARFRPGGLYLLDEPEAPLSPLRQLSFLAVLHQMVAQKAQFLIATHSPILLAFPDAQILSFDSGAIHSVQYEDLEHVKVTRSFLENPSRYLTHLFADSTPDDDGSGQN